jgi:pilus assembly protein Flp/PilA
MTLHVDFFAKWIQTKFGIALFNDSEEGQGLVEYALILVLVSIAAVVSLTLLGTTVSGVFTTITGSL